MNQERGRCNPSETIGLLYFVQCKIHSMQDHHCINTLSSLYSLRLQGGGGHNPLALTYTDDRSTTSQ